MQILSAVESMRAREREFFKKRDEFEKQIVGRVAEYEKKIESVRDEIEKLLPHLKADKEAYLKQISEYDKAIELEISNQGKIRAAFHEGQLSAGDYQKNYREPAAIERAVRFEFAKKLKPVREAIQKKSARWLDLQGQILEFNSKIRIILEEHLKKNIDFHDLRKRELEKFRSYSVGTNIPIGNSDDWRKIQIARRGIHPEPILINVESMEDLEKVVISGVIQPEHFDAMDQIILDIKQDEEVNFKTHYLRLTYFSQITSLGGPGIQYSIIRRP